MVTLWVIWFFFFFLHFSIILYSPFYEHQLVLKSEGKGPNTATCHILHVRDLFTPLLHSPLLCQPTSIPHLLAGLYSQNRKLPEDRVNLYLLLYLEHIIFHIVHNWHSLNTYSMVTVPSIEKAFLSLLSTSFSLSCLKICFLGSPLGNSSVSMCVCTDTYIWIDVYTARAETGFDLHCCIHLCFTCSVALDNMCK